MAKRKKLPSISDARKAICESFGALDQLKGFHEQVEAITDLEFAKLVGDFDSELVWDEASQKYNWVRRNKLNWSGGSREEVGNKIIQQFLEEHKKRTERMAGRATARTQYSGLFQQIFGVPLKRYYENHLIGFDVCRFDEEVVKSGDQSMEDVVRSWFGDEGVRVIKALM